MSKKQILVSLVAVPLLALLVACGGDKKDDASSSNAGGSTGSSSNSSNSSPGGGSNSNNTSSNDGAFSIENCKQYASMAVAANQGFAPSTSASPFKLDQKAMDDLVKASPSEIRADMQVYIGTIVEVYGSIEKLGINFSDPTSFARMDAAKLAEFEKLGAKFDDKKFTDASARIEKFFADKCK